MKIDLKIENLESKEVNDDRYTVDLPKSVKRELMRLPAKPRNKIVREFLIALVKENAS